MNFNGELPGDYFQNVINWLKEQEDNSVAFSVENEIKGNWSLCQSTDCYFDLDYFKKELNKLLPKKINKDEREMYRIDGAREYKMLKFGNKNISNRIYDQEDLDEDLNIISYLDEFIEFIDSLYKKYNEHNFILTSDQKQSILDMAILFRDSRGTDPTNRQSIVNFINWLDTIKTINTRSF